ncbi:MAG: DinB family protein [Candidatus Heimdallarchaeota archaeon]|nr:DinB family protein [Candidatus Heimdallarchaeota archaeon]MCK4769326.1 DinB family protein [Candidatus Heimdallarchaeota archaeon]
MNVKIFHKIIIRHFEETQSFIDKLNDEIILQKPLMDGRPLGEIVLHMIRSLEFYFTGIVKEEWKPLSYNLDEYGYEKSIKELYNRVTSKAVFLLEQISDSTLDEEVLDFSRPATKAEILQEVLEHSLHHRGQLSVYFRLLEMNPPVIEYII